MNDNKNNDMTQTISSVCHSDILLLSEGNPGAIKAMLNVTENYSRIDPMAFLGPIHFFDFIKALNMDPSAIWFLYKDICGQIAHNVVAVVRGRQLGIIPEEK